MKALWQQALLCAGACFLMAGAARGVPQAAPADPRLAKSLRVDFPFESPLSDICQALSLRTGISHKPADVATGDLRATVIGEVTIGQLQQGLADVLGIRWK